MNRVFMRLLSRAGLLTTGVIIIGAGVALVAVRGVLHQSQAPASSTESDSPRLECDAAVWEVGEVGQPTVRHTFRVSNPTAQPIRITKMGKSCTCLQVNLDREVIGPGEMADVELIAELNPKTLGTITSFRERLALHWDNEDGQLTLEMSGVYVPPLYYLTRHINLSAPERVGEPFEGTFELFLHRNKGAEIKQIKVLSLGCETTVSSRSPVGDDQYDKVVIAIKGKLTDQALPQTGTLEIHTSSAAVPVIKIPMVLHNPRVGEVKFDPPRIALGILSPGSRVDREVKLRLPAGVECGLEEVRSSASRVSVRRKEAASGDSSSLVFVCSVDCSGVVGKIEEGIVFHLKIGSRRQAFTVAVSGFVKQPGHGE